MKRSEMVNTMSEELIRWQDEDAKFGGGFKSAMRSVLNVMEAEGMIPPRNEKANYRGSIKEALNEDLRPLYSWEDES